MIRFNYKKLFNLKLSASYYFGSEIFSDLFLTPTKACLTLLSKYKLLTREAANGRAVLYETVSPVVATPKYPIPQAENFYFILKVANPEFWMYADVQGWKKEMVYFLSNTSFNLTTNQIISNAPLTAPIRFTPLIFSYEIGLQTKQGLLEIRNASAVLLKTILIRSLDASEPAGTKLPVTIDLSGYPEGLYQVRNISSTGTTNENVFCSPDFSPDALAVVQMKYRTGAWTGVNTDQQYKIIINNRQSNWLYDINIRNNTTLGILSTDLKIVHIPTTEPPIVFTLVTTSHNFAQFKSNAVVDHWQRPFRLLLQNIAGNKTYMDPLPLPSPFSIEASGGVLSTRVIVTV
ncbi:MAG TPA: hypothetical protein VF476_01570 [Chitinophagaceae bacterium]